MTMREAAMSGRPFRRPNSKICNHWLNINHEMGIHCIEPDHIDKRNLMFGYDDILADNWEIRI